MNINEIRKILMNFHLISGTEVALFDNKFHCILSIIQNNRHFCHSIHKNRKCTEMCIASDLNCFREVEKCGKMITYTCPFGFFSACAPVFKNEKIIGYLTFAPAIEIRKHCDETPVKNVLNIDEKANANQLKNLVKKIPHYTEESLNAYSEILQMISDKIEEDDLISNEEMSFSSSIKNYLDNNYRNKITLSELSLNFHCSTVTLTQHFKHKYGISIIQYVNSKRLKLAEKLLKEKTYSISYISEYCGFKDVEYFSRMFKKEYGLSPSNWIKNLY